MLLEVPEFSDFSGEVKRRKPEAVYFVELPSANEKVVTGVISLTFPDKGDVVSYSEVGGQAVQADDKAVKELLEKATKRREEMGAAMETLGAQFRAGIWRA